MIRIDSDRECEYLVILSGVVLQIKDSHPVYLVTHFHLPPEQKLELWINILILSLASGITSASELPNNSKIILHNSLKFNGEVST